jgi:hypothetical protein
VNPGVPCRRPHWRHGTIFHKTTYIWHEMSLKMFRQSLLNELVLFFWTCFTPTSSFPFPPSTSGHIFITLWQLQSCFCGAPSLTRGRVCLLYRLLALARAVLLGSESLGTRDHILLSQIWDFLFCCLLQLAGSLLMKGIQISNSQRIPVWRDGLFMHC